MQKVMNLLHILQIDGNREILWMVFVCKAILVLPLSDGIVGNVDFLQLANKYLRGMATQMGSNG